MMASDNGSSNDIAWCQSYKAYFIVTDGEA
jgi:hypothetical protein